MAKGRRASRKPATSPWVWRLALLAGVVLVGVAAYAIISRDAESAPSGAFDWGDVHGLAIDPERPERVFVATHRGLLAGTDATGWAPVGESRDDLMGFSLHPKDGDVVWSSGHPPGGGNLGVRLSTDGGLTWTRIALEGVDFHAMAVSPARPDRLWASWRSQLYQSDDAGRSWEVQPTRPPPVRVLVGHPTEPDTLYATTGTAIAISRDTGQTWATLAQVPALGLALDSQDPSRMVAGLDGAILTSTNGGKTWEPTAFAGDTIGSVAIHPQDADVIYAASYRAGLYKSSDGGATWTTLRSPK